MPSVHDVVIQRHTHNSTDWPHAFLSIDDSSGKISLTAPARFPVVGLPITFDVAGIQQIEMVHVGDFAIRMIAFVIFLGIPYSITRWISDRDWEIFLTIIFVGLDFLLAAVIDHWMAIPAVRILGNPSHSTEQREVMVMASGIGPVKTFLMAQEITDVLLSHHFKAFTPDFRTKEHWLKVQRRMLLAFAIAGIILLGTGISVFLSDLLTGGFVIP